MSCYNIMGVLINHRVKKAASVQEILTKHGCNIRMRLGLHEANDDVCANEGLVLLQVCGSADEIKALENDLNAIEGVTANTMSIGQ